MLTLLGTSELPAKTRLDKLKSNVDAQELRLEEALTSFREAKSKSGHSEDSALPSKQASEMLERIIVLMDDLISSYKEYTQELERSQKKYVNKARHQNKESTRAE